jgi:hypothetical protein
MPLGICNCKFVRLSASRNQGPGTERGSLGMLANVDAEIFVRAYVATDTVSTVALRVDTTTSVEAYECIMLGALSAVGI